MELNWFTIVAQIINFLVLVWLMKRFLYGPIVKAMQEREDRIRARLESAEDKEKEAESEKQQFREKQKELEQNKEQILSTAKEEAEQKKKEMWQEARDETDEQKEKWIESIKREKEAFLKELRQRMSRRLSDVLRKAFRDLANNELEQQVISVFLSKIQNLDDESKRTLSESVTQEDAQPTVRSAFQLPEDKKQEISDAIQAAVSNDVQIDFQTSEELISGIEFRAGGRKIAWNVDDYVQDMQQELTEALNKEINRGQDNKPQEQEEKENEPQEQKSEDEDKGGKDNE